MSYRIDATLEQGIPSLRLFDARSGEERLHWRQPTTTDECELRRAWQTLFKRIVLLSGADRVRRHPPHGNRSVSVKRKSAAVIDAQPRKPDVLRQGNVIYLLLREGRG